MRVLHFEEEKDGSTHNDIIKKFLKKLWKSIWDKPRLLKFMTLGNTENLGAWIEPA